MIEIDHIYIRISNNKIKSGNIEVHKIKSKVLFQPHNFTTRYIPKRIENINSQKNQYMSVYNSIICISQKVGTNQ